MIETFIPGERLYTVIDNLGPGDRKDVVHMIADFKFALESVTFPRSGNLHADPTQPGGIRVGQFRNKHHKAGFDNDQDMSLHAWLKKSMDVRINEMKNATYVSENDIEHYTKFYHIFQDMQDVGFFDDDKPGAMSHASLYHPDLQMGNLFVKRDPETNKLQLAGVIDWDGAEARPRILTRQPPIFLWAPEGVFEDEGLLEHWDEDVEHLPKKYWADMSAQDREFKRTFDEYVLPVVDGYEDDAYGRGFWVRRLARFAMWALPNYWDLDMVDCLEEDWTQFLKEQHGKESKLLQMARRPE